VKLNTPVAFLIFNRPEHTARVWGEICKAQPSKLLIVGDGAREDRPGEAELVRRTREVISKVDWECEVLTNLSETNLGCRRRVSSGIKWIFDTVEEAIILEDDCLPSPTFFTFCTELLEKYRNDQRIGMISGDNFLGGRARSDKSYYFTRHTHIWGWASWRRAMRHYDPDLKLWPAAREGGWLYDILGRNEDFVRYWTDQFDRVYHGEIDTWDYQLTLSLWLAGCINIQPNLNLISNIGFGPEATHTKHDGKFACLPAREMPFPLKHPDIVVRDDISDDYTERNVFGIPEYIKHEPRKRPFPTYTEITERFEQTRGARTAGRLFVNLAEDSLNGHNDHERLGWEILRLFAAVKLHHASKDELGIVPSPGVTRIFEIAQRTVGAEAPISKQTKIFELGYKLGATQDITKLNLVGLSEYEFSGAPWNFDWVPSDEELTSILKIRPELLSAILDAIPELGDGEVAVAAETLGESVEERRNYYLNAAERCTASGVKTVLVLGPSGVVEEVQGIFNSKGIGGRGLIVGALEMWLALFAAREMIVGFGPLSWSAALFNKSAVIQPASRPSIPAALMI
jgi:hypothetical protein